MATAFTWDLTLHEPDLQKPELPSAIEVLAELEKQLAALDCLGHHLAAAHLDSAIQRLRVEIARA